MKNAKSPGTRLREAREAQGKTISELAKATRIGMKQLEGIEGDNYDRIPAAIYVKGFVKNYAQALGLDPATLVEDVEKILSGDDGSQEEEVKEEERVPEPVADQDVPVVVTEPLKPKLLNQTKEKLPDLLREKTEQLKNKVSALHIPVDRRLGLIIGTVIAVLLLVFGARSCGGRSGTENAEADLPVEQLENLLIATPEPILFELPRTTP